MITIQKYLIGAGDRAAALTKLKFIVLAFLRNRQVAMKSPNSDSFLGKLLCNEVRLTDCKRNDRKGRIFASSCCELAAIGDE